MIELDSERCTVKVKGKEVKLTPKERELLRVLADADGKVVSRQDLLTKVWGENTPEDSRTVDQNVSRLRSRLGPIGLSSILTITGSGYRAVNVKAPITCPIGLIHAVKRGDRGTTAEVIWKNAFPEVKKGQKVTINA